MTSCIHSRSVEARQITTCLGNFGGHSTTRRGLSQPAFTAILPKTGQPPKDRNGIFPIPVPPQPLHENLIDTSMCATTKNFFNMDTVRIAFALNKCLVIPEMKPQCLDFYLIILTPSFQTTAISRSNTWSSIAAMSAEGLDRIKSDPRSWIES